MPSMMPTMMPAPAIGGRVTAFDADRGLGEVTGADGRIWPFHCVEIADGSRAIEIGAEVEFRPLPKLGRWEASQICHFASGPEPK